MENFYVTLSYANAKLRLWVEQSATYCGWVLFGFSG